MTIVKCQNLPTKYSAGDPYVKLQFLPDKQHKVKTRVMKKTRNPVYEEDFSFYNIESEQLRVSFYISVHLSIDRVYVFFESELMNDAFINSQTLVLHFIVLIFDRYTRDEIIGEVFFPLNSIDLTKSGNEEIVFQKDIQPRSSKVRAA